MRRTPGSRVSAGALSLLVDTAGLEFSSSARKNRAALAEWITAPDNPLTWLEALDDPQLSIALDAMLNDIATSHSVESLADASQLSRSRFAERFRDAFGCAPMTFLRDLRLRRAATMLQNRSLPVDQISRRVGFASRSHFTQLFTARFGVSPVAYRDSRSW